MTRYNPLDGRPPLDTRVSLDGIPNPGLAAIVKGASLSLRWDTMKLPAAHGAPVIYKGRELSDFTITLQLTQPEHWQDYYRAGGWHQMITAVPTTLHADKAKTVARNIAHPWLAQLGILLVVVKSVGQPVDDGKGLWTIEIKLQEYRAPQPIQQSKVEDTKAPDPVNPQTAANNAGIQAQRAEVERLRDVIDRQWGTGKYAKQP